MEVYLVPVGGERYELYCEGGPDAAASPDGASRGFWQRAVARFRAVLDAVEREEHRRQQALHADSGDAPGVGARLKRAVMRWLAERIAEQRLLWHLGRIGRATSVFPGDLAAPDARARIVAMLGRDRDRHRLWLIVNAGAFIASGILMLIPGPNLVAYYFAFRLVGHFLSMRGAQHGISGIEWTLQPSDLLASLRHTATLEPAARDRHVHDVAARLGLHGLPRFYLRTSVSGA
jgi:hypothetical protein